MFVKIRLYINHQFSACNVRSYCVVLCRYIFVVISAWHMISTCDKHLPGVCPTNTVSILPRCRIKLNKVMLTTDTNRRTITTTLPAGLFLELLVAAKKHYGRKHGRTDEQNHFLSCLSQLKTQGCCWWVGGPTNTVSILPRCRVKLNKVMLTTDTNRRTTTLPAGLFLELLVAAKNPRVLVVGGWSN